MKFQIAVGSYDLTKVHREKAEGSFSKMVQELLDSGWELRGPLQSSTDVVKRQGSICIYVTLVQDFTKDD